MPVKQIELTCYKINKLGIYSGEDEVYLSPRKLMSELKAWAFDSKKPLVETQTFDPNSQTLEAYCLDFYEEGGDYILGLWNRVPTSTKGVGSVRKNTTVEKALVTHTKVKSDSIPGFPTYFYISPKNNVFAPIKIDSHKTGIIALKQYVRGYLRHFSSHYVDRMDGDTRICGLCKESSIGEEVDNRFPDKKAQIRLSFSIDTEEAERDFLLSNAHNVTKVVKDLQSCELLEDEQATKLERVVRAFSGLPMTSRSSSRVTMPVSLTRTHVSKMLDDYDESDQSDEFNVGLILRGESNKIRWLSGSHKTISLEGQIEYHAEEQPYLKSLMALIKTTEVKLSESSGKPRNVA